MEAAQAAESAPDLRDALTQRGEMLPTQVEVSRTPLPVRREGGEPSIPWDQQGSGQPRGGVVYTYDKDWNVVPMPSS
jgi:hypothetical protein